MTKRAVLVGCNYPKTNAPLSGCINDVYVAYELLTKRFGFPRENITVLIDSQSPLPTGVNIKRALRRMVGQARTGDILFFHFSGHGMQVPCQENATGAAREKDGKDECIVGCDFNLILDDDLKAIVSRVPASARFTMVSDCCHSGTMLDGENVIIEGPKERRRSMFSSFTGGAGNARSLAFEDVQVVNRALPMEVLQKVLSERTGHEVEKGKIFSSLFDAFGRDAPRVSRRLNRLKDKIDTKIGGRLSRMFVHGASDKDINHTVVEKGYQEKERKGLRQSAKDLFKRTVFGQDNSATSSNNPAPKNGDGNGDGDEDNDEDDDDDDEHQERKIPFNAEVPVLITGCQSHETSADAAPKGDKSKAFGALTNAIAMVMAAHPNDRLTNRQLVMSVREYLKGQRFPQNPCLECGSHNADIPYIC